MGWFMGGGFPMVFIVVFGAIVLAAAVRFALTPTPGRVGPIVAYGAAVGFAAVAGVAVDLSFVGRNVAQLEAAPEELARIVMMGISESLAPAILGSAILAVTALVTAVGLRRLPPS